MLSYLKRLLWDEGAFVGMFRSMLGMAGFAFADGRPIPTTSAEWLSLIALGSALMMRSSVPAKANGGGK
jgi:hypothetical protein